MPGAMVVPETHGFQEHCLNIDPERMERYEAIYQGNPATEAFYAPAKIGDVHVVGDFGCGPGHAAIEFAKRVGPTGHVHVLDIDAEFVRRARARAGEIGRGDRITVHLLEDARLPLLDAGLDRDWLRNPISTDAGLANDANTWTRMIIEPNEVYIVSIVTGAGAEFDIYIPLPHPGPA